MCGIAGYFLKEAGTKYVGRLCTAINGMGHRGPDDAGLVLIDRRGSAIDYSLDGTDSAITRLSRIDLAAVRQHDIAFGHRRFSIIDTSAAGHQPFWSDDRQICVAFNGEIYNYVELRQTLEREGFAFRTSSDTEVLVQAYRAWGVDCFKKFIGFWAIALYDLRVQKLLLVRDRLGKAPLYYCRSESGLFWCSEIRGLLAMLPKEAEHIDEQSFFEFANWQRRDIDDRTFYRRIKTFPRASLSWVNSDSSFEPQRYWSVPTARLSESDIGIDEASGKFRAIISDAVRIRLRADVPVASQLSGGMDSSTLLALACGVKDSLDTYTVKFREKDADEEPYARLVADRYRRQVNYHVIEPPSGELLDDVDAYVAHMEAPFHSPNQFTSQRIWKTMSDKGLRVVLYGAGGDEVFAGYGSEYFGPYLRLLLKRNQYSRFLREFFLCSEYTKQRHVLNYAYTIAKMIPAVATPSNSGRIHFVPKGIDPLRLDSLKHIDEKPPLEFNERLIANLQDWRMNYWLRIDNQNSMGVPIELRSPFLDHRLVDFAFQLPESYLIRDGWLKWIVRYAMQNQLPKEIVWRRKKMGFPFPLKSWLSNHKEFFREHLKGIDCPYIDTGLLKANYEYLSRKHPNYTWGLLSLLLWWKGIHR